MLIRLIVPGEHARVEDLNTSLEAVLARHGIDAGVRGDVRPVSYTHLDVYKRQRHQSEAPSLGKPVWNPGSE